MYSIRTLILARRVFIQIVHDRRTLALLFLVPIIILALAGVLLKSKPENIPLGVVNEDEAVPWSGAEAPAPIGRISVATLIVNELEGSGTFKVTELPREEVDAALKAGQVKGVVIFEPDFSSAVTGKGQTKLELRLEGSNPSTASSILNHFSQQMMQQLASLAEIGGKGLSGSDLGSASGQVPAGLPVVIETSFLYGGPQFDSLDYVAPVMIAFFVFFFVFLLTCVFFLRERSQGTMERLLATPINRLEIVLGYVLGLGVFALLQSTVVLLFTVYALKINFAGSLLVVFLVEVVLMIVAANLGILASTFATNEFQVVQFIPMVIIPQALLGGTIWAVEELPRWLQPLSWVMPITYANQALRDVMIKGQGLGSIWGELLVLIGFAALMIALGAFAVRREVV
jgi:ABC-2 type transport system permease protein